MKFVPQLLADQQEQFFSANNMAVFSHPSYMLDLAPCNFSMFRRMKLLLCGCCVQDIPEIQEQLLTVLYVIL